ncbi:MAG: NAD/NADP octopine/nopaline dehydrogenase family protein [Lachnospiraceae bacterium]|nr:NAD/NADP octopine/nopaline dehydrogenase family protein [Lachnospiraceae bacterium]
MSDNIRVFVCGAGHQGLSMAAHLALNNIEVNLWNRTEDHIRKILDTGVIHCTGIVEGSAHLAKVSSDISEVVTDLVMVTTPSSAHKDIAARLAPFVTEDMIIVLNPGRTFGAVEFAEELKKNGVTQLPHIAETQTIVYTCRKSGEDSTTIFALKHDVRIAALKGTDTADLIERLPECLRPHFTPVDSVAGTSFSNIGMVLHCAPVVMNVGWIECEKVDFKYYYDGISRSVASYIARIDEERMNVAKAAGYEVESLKEWMERSYCLTGRDIYECIRNNDAYKEIDAPPTINTRYIFEDVPNGLVPIEAVGRELGVATPNISAVITVACTVMNTDYRTTGRHFPYKLLKEYF